MPDNAGAKNQLLYMQVEVNIREAITSGRWKPGEKIPSENELCGQFGVSRITLRNGISRLVDEGLLVRLQGKGTFVTSKSASDHMHEVMGFTAMCQQQGKRASTKLLLLKRARPAKEAAEFLGIPAGEKAIVLDRVRMVDDVPMAMERVSLRDEYDFLLACKQVDSLYDLLRKNGVVPHRAIKTIGVQGANEQQAKELGVAPGAPLLYTRALVHDDKMRPLHTTEQVIRTDLPEIFTYYV